MCIRDRSKGISPPMRTAMRSPVLTWFKGVRTSPDGVLSQTRSMFRDIQRARSSTDFLCVDVYKRQIHK